MIKSLKSYLFLCRFHQPTGIFLLLFPCLFGLGFISPNINLNYIFLFATGSICLRASGCIINDWVDHKLDRTVSRTQMRPLASGSLSKCQALKCLSLFLLGGLLTLLKFNLFTIILGLICFPLIIVYPFLKRITHYPQIFLGIIFNWGGVMASSALTNQISFVSLVLFLTCFFWTLGYDMIYAYQDRSDDIKQGIKSMAVKYGNQGKIYIFIFYSLFMAGLITLGLLTHKSFPYYFTLCIVSVYGFTELYKLNITCPLNCQKVFKKNLWIGLLIWAGILTSNLL